MRTRSERFVCGNNNYKEFYTAIYAKRKQWELHSAASNETAIRETSRGSRYI